MSSSETFEDEIESSSTATKDKNLHALSKDHSSVSPLDDPHMMVRDNPALNVSESGIGMERECRD